MLCFPKDFGICGTQLNDGEKVRRIVLKNWPVAPSVLEKLREDGTLVAMNPPDSLVPSILPNLFIRFDRVISSLTQKALLKAFQAMEKAGVECSEDKIPDKNRSSTPAYHFGVWEHYASQPRVTEDSLQKTEPKVKAVDKLLHLIATFISPKLHNMVKEYAPGVYARQNRYVVFFILQMTPG